MRRFVFLCVITFGYSPALFADCFDAVQVGDPGFVVIEKCGEPQRREREEKSATKRVELIRGSEKSSVRPVQPRIIEKWYYDASLNAATVFHLEDRGVSKKERLLREE
jgi:hypothetical protein